MAIPDYQKFMLPLMRSIASGHRSVRDCIPDLISYFGLTEEEAAELLPSGKKTVVADRAHWARTYLSKAGLLHSPRRNHHELTKVGQELLATNPEWIDNSILASFEGFDEWRRRAASGDDGVGASGTALDVGISLATPEDRISQAVAEIEADLADELVTRLLGGSPRFFESAVVDLLVAMGYGNGREGAGHRLGRAGDGGIDGIINEDALGLDAVYVQAKRYSLDVKVGRPAIQQFVGSLTGEGATKGVFVTTSSFSGDAKAYVDRVAQRIVLPDGQALARLMIKHSVGVRPVRQIVLSEIDENFFTEE
ncbi:restriction endonuclease [Limibaculum sp. FT325]|uniref:restriction endonuclease n=1 Tax=Thermohalobaculum sediminis TaxID=2939436 RepID=UPI0020BEE1F1|nr:restriction endonuclease [Limibaculum sediminis]MCL5776987.1 restriction endonuclease [Limibaculum sediminis]